MGILHVPCIICGCSFFNYNVIKNKSLFKKFFPYEQWSYRYDDFPDILIETYLYNKNKNKEFTNDIANELLKSIEFIESYNWLSNIIAIVPNGIVKNINVKDNDTLNFFDNEGNHYDPYSINSKNTTRTYIMHDSCFQLLKNKNYDMSYESFAEADILQKFKNKKTESYNVFLNKFNIDYGVADKYIDSRNIFLNYVAYVYDEYILEDPLKNNKNATRILNLKLPIKKINIKRKGPNESATLFDIGTIKVGNDKHNWIIVENINGIKKWQRIKQKGGLYNNIYYNKYLKYKTKYLVLKNL